jgi:hypothetical protein
VVCATSRRGERARADRLVESTTSGSARAMPSPAVAARCTLRTHMRISALDEIHLRRGHLRQVRGLDQHDLHVGLGHARRPSSPSSESLTCSVGDARAPPRR